MVSLAVSLLGTTDRCPQEAGTPTSSFFPPPPLGGLRPPLTPLRTSWSLRLPQPAPARWSLSVSRSLSHVPRGEETHTWQQLAQPKCPAVPDPSLRLGVGFFHQLKLEIKARSENGFSLEEATFGFVRRVCVMTFQLANVFSEMSPARSVWNARAPGTFAGLARRGAFAEMLTQPCSKRSRMFLRHAQ